MLKTINKLKEKGMQIIEEAKQELNSDNISEENFKKYSDNKVSLRMKEIMNTCNSDSDSSLAQDEVACTISETYEEQDEYSPCNMCQIGDLCKKAYSVKMPEYDTNMFDVKLECNRIICEEDEKINKRYNGDGCMPCDECSIGDICSKVNSLIIPSFDKEMFSIKINCKRFIKN